MSSTKTQQPYFPHFANSRNEDNMVRLRMAHGVAGYGVYHMLLERLRMSEGYKCELDYEILSWDLDCHEDLIRSVIYDFGLFEIVDDGQRFSSVELNAYMRLMEEKAAERKAKAQAAANARWGNSNPENNEAKVVVSQPALPLDETENELTCDFKRLDKEIENIKKDDSWLEEMAKESGKTKGDIIAYLPDFRTMCLLRGLKGGHKDMVDTLTHFRSWIYKSGRAKDPNAKPIVTTAGNVRGKGSKNQSYSVDRLDRETAERHTRWNEIEKKKADTRNYIRNKGYDPAVVTMVELMQPHWCEKNPPSHPEWIGAFVSQEAETMELPN